MKPRKDIPWKVTGRNKYKANYSGYLLTAWRTEEGTGKFTISGLGIEHTSREHKGLRQARAAARQFLNKLIKA